MKIIVKLILLAFSLTLIKADTYFEFWPNDSLKIEGEYKNGYKSGKWKYYNLNGKVWKYEVFKKGKLIDETIYPIYKPKKSEIDALEAKLREQSENKTKDSVNKELKVTAQKGSSFLNGYILETGLNITKMGNWVV